ncbi:CHAT domain-containing protein [Suillus bovinus]|uniref:CHAT domain-containing protein n=1 Tax=Suillus bovinus TaxID=48563 RepID=UPI001B871EE2|nr:CHAT domain-containing protein [Suillus bovinus]KAG2141387.1 CHAT domain-containing protein [Suillus bovinus]
MSGFVPGHFNDSDYPSPLGEGPSYPERPEDTGQKNFVINEALQVVVDTTIFFTINLLFCFATDSVPDPLDDVLGEEPGRPEEPQESGETSLVICEMLQVAIDNSTSDPLDDTLPALDEESGHPEHTQDSGEIHLSGVQRIFITSIRATDLTLGLRRIPAGFHAVVKTDSAEYQTSNQSVHVDQTVVEWHEHILLPCEPTSRVRVSVYASFELGPMLCHGELLRTFEISVGELLDRSANSHPIIFQPMHEEVVSACTSLFMTVEQRLSDENDAAVLHPLTTLTSCDTDVLALQTDAGHHLLARYRRTQSSRDLDQCINHFECALDLCPTNHPYRPAALFNVATAKFVGCQADATYLDLDASISFFQGALNLRPTDHPDRTITQLHLAIALFSRFAKRRVQTDADAAKELLIAVLGVCHAHSHIYRAALIAIETSALHSAGSTDGNDFGQERSTASMHPLSPDQLLDRAGWCLQRNEPRGLDEVISLYYDALGYYNASHACRGQLLGNLAVILQTRFERQGNDEDLDRAISLHREALALHPVGHKYQSMTLNSLANGLSTRFDHRGNDEDLDQAIALHREALALCLVGQTDRSMSLNYLATQLSTRFRHRGNDEDLDQAIALHGEALSLRPVCHADRSMPLINLAVQLFVRFNHRGNDEDLDLAIALNREALALCPVGHPDQSVSLDNLAVQLSSRFRHRGNVEDLDQAISLHEEALALRPVGHTDRSKSLNNLAVQLFTRFDHRGKDEDLNQGIALLGEALALPVGRTDRLMSLNNLALQLSSRFHHRSNDEDLDQAIALHKEALALCPVGHTDRPTSLKNLATQLSARFDHRGNDKDLDQAIALNKEALALCPVGHTDRSMSLNNLSVQLSSRFHHRGNDEDLDQAIALHREALALRPVGHTYRSMSLNNLAVELFTRFDRRGNDEDLDQAIALNQEAVGLRPIGHTDRSGAFNNLAVQLFTRFEHRGDDEDLDQAIALLGEVLTLCPAGHTDRSKSLDNLAAQLSSRFRHRGNDEDLDQAIALLGEALTLCPVGHTYRCAALDNLAVQLFSRFKCRGNDEDLDQAIAFHREALALRPVGHTDRSNSLNNLALELSARFDHRGNDEDLNQAIALHREALAVRPVGHTGRSTSLNNLAVRLSSRFRHRGNDEDLDQAIALHGEALALRPVGHTDRSVSLDNLALQLSYRFHHRSSDEDLDQAIALHREALALRPVGHTERFMSLNNLANRLSTRFEHQHNREDLDESREKLRCALTLLTQHDPRQLGVHRSLAKVYMLFHQSGLDGTGTGEDTDSLNVAMHHHKVAANVVSGGLLSRVRASLSWVHHADEQRHGTELEARATSMQLLDAYMSVTASVSSRHRAMRDFPRTLAVDAASCALRSGDVCRAVELLEQGRTVIWNQMTRLRSPLDSLQTHGDHAVALMKKFRDLSSLLDKPPANYLEETSRVDVEAEETRYRRLVEDWNRAVEEIRKIEGFSRFLLPPLFSDLQDAAREGPIIVLIASTSSCHAVIILHKQPPTSVQLFTDYEKLLRLVNALQEAVTKEAGPKGNQTALIKYLRQLWDTVVCPVVETLDRFARRGSRIWWCPTSLFSFLPLHAAGEYRAKGKSFSQYYVSSYTPSLTALIKARGSHDMSASVSFAAIGQNCPAGAEFTLDAVEPELELVRRLLPPPPTVSFSKVTSVDATKSRALCALRDNTWLHLACHGTQKFDEPFKSAFLMRDQPLSLLDVTQTDLSLHEFAFLSACETAVGDPTTPDEVVHLAAGLQFAGVKSVVGTLWKVNDDTVQRLVEAFYKNFCGDGTMSSKRAARALHRAVQSLACDTDIPLDQRIVFVHIGV